MPVEHDNATSTVGPHDAATMTGEGESATIAGARAGAYQRVDVGTTLGAYQLDRRLGSGGMGEVFAARNGPSGPLVALKVLSEVHATRLYRFKREFRALADVKHENLIALDQLVVLPNGQAFFTMELVDGVSFVEYVRGRTADGQLPNLVRLERALRQLIAGVHHLHLARCVHRDIKPSNVLVTREGRVVILDFGVISELGSELVDAEGLTRDGQMMGTPAYMAPEQTGAGTTGPAADFYAIGTMLFECLTGALPFKGSVLDILMDKRHAEAPDPAARLDAGVTRDGRVDALCKLCRRALSPEPDQRPDYKEFLATLGDSSESSSSGPTSPSSSTASASASRRANEPPFVGRKAELAVLTTWFEWVRTRGTPITVHVHGASGQGKSALIGQFLARRRRKDSVVILRGRCLERESVPYKGIDAVVDALSIYLRRLDEVESARLQPRHLAPLLQLFPVLADAWPTGGRPLDLDPGELRRRGLAALREVLARVAERRPLIVCVDDFQWADVDSARLVTELMRPPDPPPMLLIITFRDEVAEREALQLLTAPAAIEGRDVRDISVEPLSNDEARELAVALLHERDPSRSEDDSADIYARRAQGNPFYIGQMVLGDDAHSSTDLSLDRLVARRIMGLDARVQRVLAVVAVAAGPISASVVLRVCGIPESEPETLPQSSFETLPDDHPVTSPEIQALVEANLVRRHHDGRIETAHDRIREVAVGELSPDELREVHLGLGNAFEALGGGESEALAQHFARGGDEAKALMYTEAAAIDAAAALAFSRAAQLYRRALELLPKDDHERGRRLELALAEQLVDQGRGAEAAKLFISLADSTTGHDGGREARELRRRAASELVKAGYLDEGMDTIAPVLREVGLWQPRGPLMAILGTVWNRILMLPRGYAFVQRKESEVPPRLLERIDSLLATKTGLSHHEAIFAGYQESRAVRLALRAGEARRLIRCLVHDASIFIAIGRRERGRALMDTARELVTGVSEPEYHRVIEYVEANHCDHSGNWPEAAARFEKLHERLDNSPKSGWIRGASTVQLMWVRRLLGQFALLRSTLPERVATARDLGVRHELVSLGSLRALTMALDGEFEPAQRLLAELREQWRPRQLTFQHIILAMCEVELALLSGMPEQAVEAAERVLGNTKARIVASMMPSHVDFYELRARSRVQAALAGIDTARMLAKVRRDLPRLCKSHKPQVGAQRFLIEAAVHSCEGDRPQAEARWRDAAERLEKLSMAGHLAAVRARLGQREPAQAYFDAQGIVDPQRLVDAFAPGKAQ
jgi:serine/threonine protein kinase